MYKKTVWKDRIVEKPNTFKPVENNDNTITLIPEAGAVLQEGTPLNAANLNKIENGLEELNSQLDTNIQQVTNLQSTKMDKNTREISVGQIDKNKGKFDQTYMTDEFLQQMAGNSPINYVPSTKSITTDKLAFTPVIGRIGKNIFNKETALIGKFVNNTTGAISTNASYAASDFIEVIPNTQYTKKGTRHVVFYDINFVFISGLGSGTTTFTTPTNCYYIRINTDLSFIDNEQVEKGASSTNYEQYRIIIPSEIIEDASIGKEKVSFNFMEGVQGKNKFNKATALEGKFVNGGSQGSIANGTGYFASDFIEVEEGMDYYLSNVAPNTNVHAWYDRNKVFISSIVGGSNDFMVTAPTNSKYIRFTTTTSLLNQSQLEKGTVKTSYQEYGVYLPISKIDGLEENTNNSEELLRISEQLSRIIKGGNVLLVGDSITAGQTDTRRYEFWLRAYMPTISIRNVAVAGTTIRYHIENIDVVKNLNPLPDTIILLIGTNSTGTGGVARMMVDYKELVDLYLALGIKPILVTLLPRSDDSQRQATLKEFNDFLRYSFAPSYGLPLVDVYSSFCNEDGTIKAGYMNVDGLHPEIPGYQVLAQEISKVLKKIFPTTSRDWTIPDDINRVVNPLFIIDNDNNGRADSWSNYATSGVTATYSLLDHPTKGKWQQIQRNGGVDSNSLVRLTQDISGVNGGEKWLIGIDVDSGEVNNCSINVTYNWYDSTDTNITGGNLLPKCPAKIENTRFENIFLAPSNAVKLRVSLVILGTGQTTVRFGRVMAKKINTL